VKGNLELRLIREDEIGLWESYMREFHPLSLPEKKSLPGELLRYVAILDGRWAALIAWSSAALKCAPRERFIGWSEEKRIKRLKYITNNVRFLILPWVRVKNFASRVLSLNLRRLSRDYEVIYGHPVYLAETFVDLSLYRGSCYKAANFIFLGETKGFSKNGRYYYPNGRPKGVFVYPLTKGAERLLGGEFFSEGGAMDSSTILRMNEFPVEGLVEVVKKVTDPRSRRGRRYPLYSLLGLALCATLCGARSFIGIGDWVKGLSEETLRRFGIRRGAAPDESTIRRAIQRVDVREFDNFISDWLMSKGIGIGGKGVAIDGKTVKGSRDGERNPIHLLSAIIHKEGVVIASKRVADKTNEIREVRPLLADLSIEGAVVTADALLTQKEIASYVVEEKKADYLFTVKGNQKTLLSDVEDHFKLESFPPSAHDNR